MVRVAVEVLRLGDWDLRACEALHVNPETEKQMDLVMV
jgi:hypothetical protein